MCTKDVTIGSIRFKKGVLVTVPTYALHRSKEYYSDPERFDPDRLFTFFSNDYITISNEK